MPLVSAAAQVGGIVDSISFADSAAETAHALDPTHSEVIDGGLGERARRLLPQDPASFDGGTLTFNVKIDPHRQNYFTVKLWGSDHGTACGRLILLSGDRQIGYRHEGDYDVLNQCDEEGEAPGRFFYQTLPLPPSLTGGKSTMSLTIAALGRMWPYGASFAQYQKNLTDPSRGIYRVYTHIEPRFIPDEAEKQGEAPASAVRPAPGEEVIDRSKTIVVDRLEKLLASSPSGPAAHEQKTRATRLLLVAEAYNTPWTPAHHNARAIEQIVRDGDSMAGDFASDARYAAKDWPGAGPLGEAIMRTWPAVQQRLDELVKGSSAGNTRRQSWSDALRASIDYWRTHRRDYTNQSMIVDRNIYTANRALQLIDPARALPEAKALRYLYEAVGLEPWLGSDPSEGKADLIGDVASKGTPKPYGEHYFLVTRKGLTRELGWVATYGETILHFAHDIAQLTGDEKIRQQLARLVAARMPFRYPGVDGDGYRCMKLVSEADNRTAHFPLAGSAYLAPNVREEWWMDVPALLSDDPLVVGAAQRSLDDNQYFAYVQSRLKDSDTLGMMRNVDQYAKVKALPASSYQFPMADGQPDFVFADEEDAMIAIRHGQERLFVNLYYRAERAVNNVARIFDLTPSVTVVPLNGVVQVKPSTTVVLYLGE